MAPLGPPADAPVRSDTSPLTPEAPLSGDAIDTPPLDVIVPAPELSITLPPTELDAAPPRNCKSAPRPHALAPLATQTRPPQESWPLLCPPWMDTAPLPVK
jgi:hypothetical protein